MESLKKNKTLLIVFGISLVAFLFYQFGGALTSVTGQPVVIEADGQETTDILKSLDQMQRARIDTELLSSTVWTSLVDHAVALPTDVPGKTDLFGSTIQSNQVGGATLSR